MDSALHYYHCTCRRRMQIDKFGAGRLNRCPECKAFVIVPLLAEEEARRPIFDFRTPRLDIGLVGKKHWREFHEISSDERNYSYELSTPSTVKQTKVSIKAASFPSGFAKSKSLKFHASVSATGRTIGIITVHFSHPYYGVHIGFMFHHDFHVQGYGSESITALCDHLHRDLGVEKIVAMCDSKNLACRAVLEKAGFAMEGLLTKFWYHSQRGWVDAPAYARFRQRAGEEDSSSGPESKAGLAE